MKKAKIWIIDILIGLIIVCIIIGIVYMFIIKAYTKRYERQNEDVKEYMSQTTIAQETTVSEMETLEDKVYVEVIESEVISSKEYWDPGADKEQVYFKDSSLITTQGFLPYDVLGPLTDYLKVELRQLGDSSRELIIDSVNKTEIISVIEFNTEKGKYSYRYYWESNTQELMKVE